MPPVPCQGPDEVNLNGDVKPNARQIEQMVSDTCAIGANAVLGLTFNSQVNSGGYVVFPPCHRKNDAFEGIDATVCNEMHHVGGQTKIEVYA